MRPKLHPWSLCHIFVDCTKKVLYKVLWRFDQISRSYKFTKFCIQRMWRHTGKCIKHVTPGFLCIFCHFYGENTSYKRFMVFFIIFHELVELQSFEGLNWRHTCEWTNKICYLWLTCKLLKFFINVILFYDEKGSF